MASVSSSRALVQLLRRKCREQDEFISTNFIPCVSALNIDPCFRLGDVVSQRLDSSKGFVTIGGRWGNGECLEA